MKTILTLVFAGVVAPASAWVASDTSTEKEVRAAIHESLAYSNEHKVDMRMTSQHGSVEFWSSGGLMQWVSPNQEPARYDNISLRAKHIDIVTITEGQAAVAMYYMEGSIDPVDSDAVSHYLTRVTEVWVKENGTWKIRAGHWSPVAGGSGTSATASKSPSSADLAGE